MWGLGKHQTHMHAHTYVNNTEGIGRKEFKKKKRVFKRQGLQGKD